HKPPHTPTSPAPSPSPPYLKNPTAAPSAIPTRPPGKPDPTALPTVASPTSTPGQTNPTSLPTVTPTATSPNSSFTVVLGGHYNGLTGQSVQFSASASVPGVTARVLPESPPCPPGPALGKRPCTDAERPQPGSGEAARRVRRSGASARRRARSS